MKYTKKQCEKKIAKWQKRLKECKRLDSAWYKHPNNDHPDWIIYYDFEQEKGYGFNTDGSWSDIWDNDGYIERYSLIKATREEVEQALIKEAERRGFKDDMFVESVYDKFYSGNINIDTIWVDRNYHVWCDSESYSIQLFEDGKWAEIIEETKRLRK